MSGAHVLTLLKVNPERALEELNLDWTASQNIADVLMKDYGVPFREGHHFASDLVTFARSRDYTPLTLPYEDAKALYEKLASGAEEGIPKTFPLTEYDFRSALDPRSIVNSRATRGGPQPTELTRLFREAEDGIRSDSDWVSGKKTALAAAEKTLDEDFEALCALPG